MINRYTVPVMNDIWSDKNRFMKYSVFHHTYLQSILGRSVTLEELDPDLEMIAYFEKQTKHELQASLLEFETRIDSEDDVAKASIHKHLTSSDVIDTVLSHTIKEAATLLHAKINNCLSSLTKLIENTENVSTIGRTHGRHATPMSLDSRFKREWQDLLIFSNDMLEQASNIPGKIAGTIGEYQASEKTIEDVNSYFDLSHYVSPGYTSQALSRAYHAKLTFNLALLGSLVERLATNIRLLSFNEINELSEAFTRNQAGSSSMPHKKNPIGCENLVGIARLLRSYVTPSLENVPLWLERDMSHSSVERVILPDAFNLAYYMFTRLEEILNGLIINTNQIDKNLTNYFEIGNSHEEISNTNLPRSLAYTAIQDKYLGT